MSLLDYFTCIIIIVIIIRIEKAISFVELFNTLQNNSKSDFFIKL